MKRMRRDGAEAARTVEACERNRFLQSLKEERGVALSEVQREAVLRTDGPMLLLASPGSGKTTTLIARIGLLVQEKKVNPSRIKAVTFSRASAADMKERFGQLFPALEPVLFSTIHSLAFEIVRSHFHQSGVKYVLIEGDSPPNKRMILRELYRRFAGNPITDDEMDELTTYISYIKNKMIAESGWESVKAGVKHAAGILREYEAIKRSGDKLLLDYDDMLTMSNDLLERNERLLRSYQSRYDYVLTDESQDTSMVQHAIIEKLARSHRNLCVVADDDQSIYSWRGAEPSYLLRFKEVYPDAAILFMEQNYRSSRQIVEAANQFIKRNKQRYEKNMFTANPPAVPIKFRSLSDYRLQAKYLVQQMQGVERLSEAAILYRNNSSSIALMNAFDRAGIPFYMKDADNRFFSHWVVEDVLNFMRMSYTDKRPELLEKIHAKMIGYISKHQMAVLLEIENGESVFDNLLGKVQLHDYQLKPLQEARDILGQLRGMPPLHAIRVIRSRLGYEKALDKMCERLGMRRDYLIGILNTLEDIAEGLDTLEDFAARLKSLEAALKGSRSRKDGNAVTFSTLHSAKGLEFDHVYMIDLVDGILPSSDDGRRGAGAGGGQEAMEEAVRLFYVGMTRARIQLELVTYRERDGEEMRESPFMTAVRHIADPEWESRERATAGSSGGDARQRRVEGSAGDGARLGRKGGLADDGARTGANKMQRRSKQSHPSGPVIVQEGRSAVSDHIISSLAIRSVAALKPGQRVKHRVFGNGTIEALDSERIAIAFAAGSKSLSLSACLDRGLLEPADD